MSIPLHILPVDTLPALSGQARCPETDPEIFFVVRGDKESDEEVEARKDEAKAVCRSCEVQRDCLTFALDTDQRWGIWGGQDMETMARERRAEWRREQRRRQLRQLVS